MDTSYGVVWREDDLPQATGKLVLLPEALRLEGLADRGHAVHEIGYESLGDVRIGRAPAERLDGRPSIQLELRDGRRIAIAAVGQPGVLAEIVERLAALQVRAGGKRAVVVVPLREGAQEAVRALLEQGPPFDPAGTGLERHNVHLTPHEAIFTFESSQGSAVLESLLAEPRLWQSAAGWQDHLAGAPRLAEDVYVWKRPAGANGRSLPPTEFEDGG